MTDNSDLYRRMRETLEETDRLLEELRMRTFYQAAKPTRAMKLESLSLREKSAGDSDPA